MFTRKLQLPQHGMPTAEEFALWGARELTYEELLEVNGGRHVIDDPRTNDISDTIADGGHSPRGSESTGNNGSSGGSVYTPPEQNQPVPKPPAGNNAPPTQNQPETLSKGQKQEMSSKNNTPLSLNKPDFKPVYDNYRKFLGYGDEAEKRKIDLQKAPSLDASFSIGGSMVLLQGYTGFNISQDYSGNVDVNPKLSADIGVFAPGVTATVSLGVSLPGNEGANTQELNLNVLGFGGSVVFSEKGITSFNLAISANTGYQGDKSDMGIGYNLFKR